MALTKSPAWTVQFLPSVAKLVAILTFVPVVVAAVAVAAPNVDTSARDVQMAQRAAAQRLVTSSSASRIALPPTRVPLTLEVRALERVLRLQGPKDPKELKNLATRLAAHASGICPTVAVRDDALEITCRSKRIDAQLNFDAGSNAGVKVTAKVKAKAKTKRTAMYLDIVELRGLPWRDGPDAAPFVHYDPFRSGLGQACPGRGAVRGECQLKQGEILEAATAFRGALESTGRPLASVRLGDIALRAGDPVTAAGWYRRAGTVGVFGRVAVARACELDGKCLATAESTSRAFDLTGLPEPVRQDMVLRRARAEAYADRIETAVQILSQQFKAHGPASVCRGDAETLCRRIILAALREAAEASTAEGGAPGVLVSAPKTSTGAGASDGAAYLHDLLDTYLALPGWDKGPLAVELAQMAAPVAAKLGAPVFGASLLSALVPEVSDRQLAHHLLLTCEMYLRGRDWARARLISEYADTRLSKANLADSRWTAVRRKLGLKLEEGDLSPQVRKALEAELQATLAELKESAAVHERVASLMSAARNTGNAKGASGTSSASAPAAAAAGKAPGSGEHVGKPAEGAHAPSSAAAMPPAGKKHAGGT